MTIFLVTFGGQIFLTGVATDVKIKMKAREEKGCVELLRLLSDSALSSLFVTVTGGKIRHESKQGKLIVE